MPINYGVCQGCAKKIVWGITEDDKRIPMDPVPAVYFIHGIHSEPETTHGGNEQAYRVKRANGNKDKAVGQAMVSHFATCPKAQDFSHRGRTT